MPDGTRIDPQAADRAKLREAVTALHEGERKLALLLAARERATEERLALSPRLRSLEAELEQAKRDEPARIAEAFTNQQPDVSPIPDAEAALDAAQAEYRRLCQIEDTIDAELETTRNRIERYRAGVNAALAEVICGSDQFSQLFVELEQAWARLRGIRKAFHVIERGLHGYLPHEFANWQSVPSLDPEATNIPTDEAPAAAWKRAMQELEVDPDAPLPNET